MHDDLTPIIEKAKTQITDDIANLSALARLQSLRLNVVDASTLAKCLYGKYKIRRTRVPAYYDPNTHIIYLNHSLLKHQHPLTAHIVCYHELLHAISFHDNFARGNANIFRSGLKTETYQEDTYACAHRQLNEGVVQFLTNFHNKTEDSHYAYAQESKLVRNASAVIGIEPFTLALLEGTLTHLTATFESAFGPSSFLAFSQHIESGHYISALSIITPELIPAPLFADVPALVQ